MFNRPLLFLGILAAAVVVPYVLLDENLSRTAKSQLSRLTGGGDKKSGGGFSLPWLSAGNDSHEGAPHSTAKFIAAQPVSLEEALRFDVTPPWVAARWPHVSTVAGGIQHMGLRVALVSGTQPTDVAGSLTYYFNDRHEVERITLEALTGDESRIVAFAALHYGLRPTPTLAAGLYIAGNPAKPTSTLRVLHLPTVRADQPLARAQVSLDLARSASGRSSSTSSFSTPFFSSQPTAASSSSSPTIPQHAPLPLDYRRW